MQSAIHDYSNPITGILLNSQPVTIVATIVITSMTLVFNQTHDYVIKEPKLELYY